MQNKPWLAAHTYLENFSVGNQMSLRKNYLLWNVPGTKCYFEGTSKNWPTPASFLFIFALFKHPFDHHHGPMKERLCDETSMWRNVYVTKRLCDETFMWQNVYVTKRLCDETFMWQNVYVMKHLCDETSMRWNIYVTKCLCDETSMWRNVSVRKCLFE